MRRNSADTVESTCTPPLMSATVRIAVLMEMRSGWNISRCAAQSQIGKSLFLSRCMSATDSSKLSKCR